MNDMTAKGCDGHSYRFSFVTASNHFGLRIGVESLTVFLFSGRMSDLDYAVISKWFDWIMRNSAVDVDLIGECTLC